MNRNDYSPDRRGSQKQLDDNLAGFGWAAARKFGWDTIRDNMGRADLVILGRIAMVSLPGHRPDIYRACELFPGDDVPREPTARERGMALCDDGDDPLFRVD